MACDFSALANLDTGDPEQATAVLEQCLVVLTDPRWWIWGMVLTFLCALVGAWIGKYKNAVVRDAVLGAALGPIGWIISLLLPKRAAPRTCPQCAKPVDARDVHCRHCGGMLGA